MMCSMRLCALVFLSFSACDRPHESSEDLHAALDAVKFGDRERVFQYHADSTDLGMWCSEQFKSVLNKAREAHDEAECGRLEGMTRQDLDAMPDELRLAVQVARFVCEDPTGECTDYARFAFFRGADADGILSGGVRDVVLRRHFGDGLHAAAYVEFHLKDGQVVQRTLKLRKLGSRWRITGGLLQ